MDGKLLAKQVDRLAANQMETWVEKWVHRSTVEWMGSWLDGWVGKQTAVDEKIERDLQPEEN